MPSSKLSADDIAAVASKAGFGKDKATLATAIAVALAESSGNPKAVSPTGCCHGLWQINTEVHPYTKSQMQDPQANANAAYSISKQGTKWSPWSAYNMGMHLMYLPTANAAADKIATGGAHDSAAGVIQEGLEDQFDETGLGSLAAFPEKVRLWLSDRNNIFRIVKVLAGGALLIAGVYIIGRPVVASTVKELKK